ncbi:MAG TPA: hypothetical protein PLP05_05520 [Sedimentisphaerales bacterium]|nr:hypothetical protein [Sedimentisphaerales bacterium]
MSLTKFSGLILTAALTTILVTCSSGAGINPTFKTGKPVWITGKETEQNLSVGFRAVFDKPESGQAVLKLTASTLYRVYLNGEFVGHGPARAAHGYYRVDEWNLSKQLKDKNILAIEVAGYNVNSYYLLNQPSFLQAEVLSGENVIASTQLGGENFKVTILNSRVQKVQRYCFQRPFIEYYKLVPGFDDWKTNFMMVSEEPTLTIMSEKKLLPRRVSYPRFEVVSPVTILSEGSLITDAKVENPWRDRALVNIGPALKGFKMDELEEIISDTASAVKSESVVSINKPFNAADAILLKDKTFKILDLGSNLTGFAGMEIKCDTDCKLMVTFDEILRDNDVDFKRMECVNVITYQMKPGTYKVESFEPYTMRYIKLNLLEGQCQITNPYLRLYENSDCYTAYFFSSDDRLNRIFKAAVNTFKQNSIDIFMDCPSRERAGWLCDSYRTSQAEYCLTGQTSIEHNFLENYLLPEKFDHLPEGMLAMCYPSDHDDGCFIPNWAMWFVLELEIYKDNDGDIELINSLKPRVMALLDYFKKFENSDGLLENLEGWIFVDWSAANDFVKGVNYPTNMLYAATLKTAGKIYNQPELSAKAENVKKQILRQSFNGEFFVDNAIRKDSLLQRTENCSESCQYYAFYFNIADATTHSDLWQKLVSEFGPDRAQTKAYPNVKMGNALLGNWMRLQLFSRLGLYQQLKDETIDYLLYMADKTNTLWEHVDDYASCNHGFASHIVCNLIEDILGIGEINHNNKTVTLKFTDTDLGSCTGQVPTKAGIVTLNWRVDGDSIIYKATVPNGYKIITNNLTGKKLVQK